jgi:hypothetical protein
LRKHGAAAAPKKAVLRTLDRGGPISRVVWLRSKEPLGAVREDAPALLPGLPEALPSGLDRPLVTLEARRPFWRSAPVWKHAATLGLGLVAFGAAFIYSGPAVTFAAALATKLGGGPLLLAGSQMLGAGVLGAGGGAGYAVVSQAAEALGTGIADARYRGTHLDQELRGSSARDNGTLRKALRHATVFGFAAGASLAGLAVLAPTYVFTALRWGVYAAAAIEGSRVLMHGGLWAKARLQARAARTLGDSATAHEHRRTADGEALHVVLGGIDLTVLGILNHSLGELDPTRPTDITTGVAQSGDEMLALGHTIGESIGALTRQAEDAAEVPALARRTRDAFRREISQTPPSDRAARPPL